MCLIKLVGKEAGEKFHNEETIGIDLKMTEMMELADKYVKTAIVNMIHIYKHNEDWNERYKKEKLEHTDIKNIVTEMEILLDGIKYRSDLSGDKSSELENVVRI